MESLEFSVDHELRLVSANEALSRLCPNLQEHFGQTLYFEVLPRIASTDEDEVWQVLRSGSPRHLQRVVFPCFYGLTQAVVEIEPLCEQGRVHGAKVLIQRQNTCVLAERLDQVEHLVDIGKMASSLAHGVRNPLNAIKGAVVYLQRRYAHESDLLEFTGIMQEEIARLDRFITDFLSASLHGSDQTPTDLNALLQRARRFVSLQAQTAGVAISFDPQPLPLLSLNVFQVEQAILNLLNNALSVLGPGGGILIASSLLPDGRFVAVKISDTGPGLSDQALSSLSCPQKHRAQTQGRGFGLFLTREVMQHHGGTIEIQSAPGTGTLITLCFPVPSQAE